MSASYCFEKTAPDGAFFIFRGGELVKRYGRQTPTFERVGICDHSDGPEAVALFGGYGIRFIPAQRYEMELYLAKNELGESEALTIGLSRPRQNGKSFAARYYALWQAKTTKRRAGRKAVGY